MLLFFLGIFAAATAAYWYIYLWEPASQDVSPAATFKAVAIVCDDSVACPAALALDGKRFLSDEAPKLPLPDCTVAACTCTFHHHPDRRKGSRRASETGMFAPDFDGCDERQESSARRFTDIDETEQLGDEAADTIDPFDTYYDFIAKDS